MQLLNKFLYVTCFCAPFLSHCPQMPRLDGWGLCDEIRKTERRNAVISSASSRAHATAARPPKTIVIGMSAAGTNNEEKAAQAGMDGFLVKPFSLEELMGILTRTSRGGNGNTDSAGVAGFVSGAATGGLMSAFGSASSHASLHSHGLADAGKAGSDRGSVGGGRAGGGGVSGGR